MAAPAFEIPIPIKIERHILVSTPMLNSEGMHNVEKDLTFDFYMAQLPAGWMNLLVVTITYLGMGAWWLL